MTRFALLVLALLALTLTACAYCRNGERDPKCFVVPDACGTDSDPAESG